MEIVSKAVIKALTASKENLSLSVVLIALILPVDMVKFMAPVMTMDTYTIIMYSSLCLAGLMFSAWVIYCFIYKKS